MKKYLISIMLGLTSVVSLAQTSGNVFAERADLIKKFGTAQLVSVGWYTGVVSNKANDIREINENFLGLSNYLSIHTNNLVILEAIKSDRTVVEEGLKGNFDILYTSAVMGSQLIEKGWKPLVERSEEITPVLLALKSNNKINSEKDIPNVKVLGSKGISFTFMSYSLSNAKLLDINNMNKNENFLDKKISQESLIFLLNNKQADAIIVRSVVAEKLMKGNDNYKVVYKGQVSPGSIVFLSPKLDEIKEQEFRQAFLSLNGVNKNHTSLKGIDGHEENKQVFKNVVSEDITLAKEVFSKTKQVPLVNRVK